MPKPFASISDAVDALPDGSRYRAVLAGLWSEDRAARRAGEDALSALRKPYWEPPVVTPEAEAVTVLRAVLEVPAPGPVASVAFSLIGSATPAVIALARGGFEGADEDTRLNLLTLVASANTRDGAEVFAELVGRHGWTPVHPRLLMELGKNVAHADVLFPALLDAKDAPATRLTDLLIAALQGRHLDPARLAQTEVALTLGERIDELLASKEETAIGELAARLDLAAHLGGESVVPRLRAALAHPHAWPRAFAVLSLLRRGMAVPDDAIARVAADPATRGIFYRLTKEVGATARIPEAYRTRDAFAESDMVGWLSHPGELGQPPKAIEKMAVFEVEKGDERVVLYVWRFQSEESAVWKASVSGPYPVNPPEGPLSGPSTFSRFDPWDKCTAEEHASAVLKTLSEWAAARR